MMDHARFMQGTETVKVIKNEDLVCSNCRYLIPEDTAACDQFECKPIPVLEGGPCKRFAGKG